jgi:DNA polymerase-3 subunit gamma/tau
MVMPNDQQLDDAIDRAVRELMSVDPPEGLRARVLARLEDRQPAWRPYGLLAGAAAVAVVVLLAWLPFRSSRQEPAPQVATSSPASVQPREPARAAAPTPAPAPAPAPRAVLPRPRTASPAIVDRRRARLSGEVVAANATLELETGPQPLEALPEIGLSAIAPARIETTQVSVSPLASPPRLQIDPLPPPGRQN